jgi:zinc protease
VERAKTWLVKNIELTLNNSDVVGLWLSEWASLGDWRLLFLHRDRLKSVTVADVQRVVATYLKPDNRTVGLYYPTEKPDRVDIPAPPDVAALVKDYRGDTTLAVGEAFDPSPANIEARTTRITLPSGFKLALLPKKTRGHAVFVTLNLRYGSEQALMNRGSAAGLVASMLLRGTTSKSRQQIQDDLDRLKARVFFFGNPMSAGGGIETTRDNLPTVLRLVGEVLRQPAFDAKEFAALKQEEVASREQQRSEPSAKAIAAFNRHLNPWPKGHPRYFETIDEQIANLTATSLDDVKKFYAEFYGATGEMAVVGDFDANQVRTIASEIFGRWKSPQPYQRVPQVFREVPVVNETLEAPDKAMAFFLAGQNLNPRDDDPDYPALVLGNYLLGGGFLNSRLAARIRQQDGISYGVWSNLWAGPFDKAGGFQAGAIYAPENRDKLEADL